MEETKLQVWLQQEGEESYRTFTQKLIPGLGFCYGVRMPKLRVKAKAIARANGLAYLTDVWKNPPQALSHEEKLLAAMVLGAAKTAMSERLAALKQLLPYVDNWAVCDCLASSFPVKTAEDHQEVWAFLRPYWDSPAVYDRRAAAVFALSHFLKEEWLDEVLAAYGQVPTEEYYVSMAVAWGVSMAFVAFPAKTKQWLLTGPLERGTLRRTYQKIMESRQVSQQDRDWIQKMKQEG